MALIERLRSTYWFVPAVVTGAATALGFLLTFVDAEYPGVAEWFGLVAYGGGVEGALSLLSSIAGSTITVVSVTFSVMVVALTVASQHFGPRVLNSFMRDTGAQLVLGTFTGTFVYCLVVLRTVRSSETGEVFVPGLSVAAALALTIVSVGVLIYYVHHIAKSLQVAEIAASVANEFEHTVDRLYPERMGEEPDAGGGAPPLPPDALPIRSTASGYIQAIDSDAVLRLAVEHETTLWLTSRPGDFIVRGLPLGYAYPRPRRAETFQSEARSTVAIGKDRTANQDVAFTVQQLVEVALRALSPGVNEPFTAITCIDRLGQGLARLAVREMPSAARIDREGRVRVVAEPYSFESLLEAALEPIAVYSDRNPAIGERLLGTLNLLAGLVHRPEDREAVSHVADFVRLAAERQVADERHLSQLARLHLTVQESLRTPRPARP